MATLIKPPSSPFEPPPLLHQILTSPLKFLARNLYALLLPLRGPPFPPYPHDKIRIVCISDTHSHTPTSLIPPGDILIHAGDLTNSGTHSDIQDQINWLDSLPHAHKVVIAGNHDGYLDPRSRPHVHSPDPTISPIQHAPQQETSSTKEAEKENEKQLETEINFKSIIYLQNTTATISFPKHSSRRLHIYGAPQIPACGGPEFAFQYPRHNKTNNNKNIKDTDQWSGTIPRETDILITHTPPRHHLDLPRGMGCAFLLAEVWRIRPLVHIFGHVHCGYGRTVAWWDEGQRAMERICERDEVGEDNDGAAIGRILVVGIARAWFRDLLDVGAWLDLVRIVVYGVLGILWLRVWGAEPRGTVMVNAAMVMGSTGRVGNEVQVVDV